MVKIGVLFVYHSNICRSPMTEFVFRKLLDEEDLADGFYVVSAGTGGEYIGDSVNRRVTEELKIHGISCEDKRGRRIHSDFTDFNYIVGMDRQNMEYIYWIAPSEPTCEIGMLMEYADGGEISDLYYTRDFGRTYRDLAQCRRFLDHIVSRHLELRRWPTSGCLCRYPFPT